MPSTGSMVVAVGATSATLTGSFPAEGAPIFSPSWPTAAAITAYSTSSITVVFSVPPSVDGTLAWAVFDGAISAVPANAESITLSGDFSAGQVPMARTSWITDICVTSLTASAVTFAFATPAPDTGGTIYHVALAGGGSSSVTSGASSFSVAHMAGAGVFVVGLASWLTSFSVASTSDVLVTASLTTPPSGWGTVYWWSESYGSVVLRNSEWVPTWLITFAGVPGEQEKRFSDLDQVYLGETYHGRLLNMPEVSKSFGDTFWGQTEVSDLVIRISNPNDATSHLYQRDLRGTGITAVRYDRASRIAVTEFTGIVTAQLWHIGAIEIHAQAPDLSVFEQEIPKQLTSTSLFTSNIIDEGRVVPIVFGNRTFVPLPYVNDDVISNVYDYLVGFGSLTVSAVYRNGPNGLLRVVDDDEYAVETSRYAGFTTLRFTTRQLNYSNQLHTLYADIQGLSTERNFARAIQTILSNSVWGLGRAVNTASFDLAAAELDTVGGLYCDGVLSEPRQAQDVLRELMMVRGMRLSLNAAGEWTISVDQRFSTIRMVVADGPGDQERTLLAISNRRRKTMGDAASKYRLRYHWNHVVNQYRLEVTRTLHAFGREIMYEHPFIQDDTTADKVVDYLAKRERYGEETVDVEIAQEGRYLTQGDLVQLYAPAIGYHGERVEALVVAKTTDRIRATLGSWDAEIYAYVAGDPPATVGANPLANALTDPQPAIRETLAPVTCGTLSGGYAGIAFMLDVIDSEIDIFAIGLTAGGVCWGESSMLGVETAALASLGDATDYAAPAGVSDGVQFHLALVNGSAGTQIIYRKYDRDGTRILGPSVIWTVTHAGCKFYNSRVALGRTGNVIFWVWIEAQVVGVGTDYLMFGTTDLSGSIITGPTTILASVGATNRLTYVELAVDEEGNSVVCYPVSGAVRFLRVDSSGGILVSELEAFALPAGVGGFLLGGLVASSVEDDITHVFLSESNNYWYARVKSSTCAILTTPTKYHIGNLGVLSVAQHPTSKEFFLLHGNSPDVLLSRIRVQGLDEVTGQQYQALVL